MDSSAAGTPPGRPAAADGWPDDADALLRAYVDEPGREIKLRLHALVLVRRGAPVPVAARAVGASVPSVQRWVDWYRQGGVDEVRRRQYRGRVARLTPAQQRALLERARRQPFLTTQEAQRWTEAQLGVRYTHSGMRWLLERLGLKDPGHPLRETRFK
ncbi:MAG TPA: helix-turn-helix domain-containing protein [Chloroflexota bacterium]|nr:helix-turn-helix domain-containing protein [Chloroflexota bacterium]